MINGVEYLKIDEAGLHTRINGELKIFDVDTVIVCAGQLSSRGLYDELQAQEVNATLVGGAFEAANSMRNGPLTRQAVLQPPPRWQASEYHICSSGSCNTMPSSSGVTRS